MIWRRDDEARSSLEGMQAWLDLLEEIYRAEERIDAGDGVAHDEAKAQVLVRLA